MMTAKICQKRLKMPCNHSDYDEIVANSIALSDIVKLCCLVCSTAEQMTDLRVD